MPLPLSTEFVDGQLLVVSEAELVEVALALGADQVGGPLSSREAALLRRAHSARSQFSPAFLESVRSCIAAGDDPLGATLMSARTQAQRRQLGAVYTPPSLVEPMISWVLSRKPELVVDAGAGSGRFSVGVARSRYAPSIIAVEIDPVASILTRAAFHSIRFTRATVVQADFTTLTLPDIGGKTAFVGNPPYVRHHDISPKAKAWAQVTARQLGLSISGLAGLHAYFFLASAALGRDGDTGCFVTSSEWLDVNYGATIRDLLLGRLGGQAIHFLEPAALPFEQTATTAAITCFEVGASPKSMRLRRVKKISDLAPLKGGRTVSRERLSEAARWTPLVLAKRHVPDGFVELGELCRVHRGSVTGSNAVWVTASNDNALPNDVLYPAVTRARELFDAGDVLKDDRSLRRVIDLPEDLDVFDSDSRHVIEAFLRKAKRAGVPDGYIARCRRAWWAIGLRPAAPILATYMARRPPAFVRNLAGARHINIAHGLYPRVDLPPRALDRLAESLRSSVSVSQGRTYAGGLTKFEPKEMERLPVPGLDLLLAAP